jgi:8-oxo-dGTP pyrophosphatase MutT (NUDIX family)
MKKVFINETPLYLCNVEEATLFATDKRTLKGRFFNLKTLHSYVDMMEKPHAFDRVVLFHEDEKELWQTFKKFFKIIKAAGGVVKNEKNEILFIFRRGSWDLPKGKIDAGEKKKIAAIREVNEETGIENITLTEKILTTYHIYTIDNQRILKKTYWYNMTCATQTLVPQTEEDIEQAVWLTKADFFAEPRKIYGNIKDILDFV